MYGEFLYIINVTHSHPNTGWKWVFFLEKG